ncbi:MAG: signal peptidase I [Gammaproteobacteria bacterium]|nr:signal peptidase I [Gammaproteobacteria bacterium]MDH5628550.1 signal peptidase I [Gammaproteobacteria bacterium]
MSNDYGLILVILTVVSGIIWLVDALTAGKTRKAAIQKLLEQEPDASEDVINSVAQEPIHVDYAKSFFPILLFIIVLRSFLYEPFQIPSGSMKPGLVEGDFILVNKYRYGLRWPVTSKKFIEMESPKRGDIAVFRAPDTGEDYIKRVIGLPGDTVVYTLNKQLVIIPQCADEGGEGCQARLTINKDKVPGGGFVDSRGSYPLDIFDESIEGAEYQILNNSNLTERDKGFHQDQVFLVPQGQYFVMGDNRDNSLDSRYWKTTHFVPEENLVGQAVAIWMHLDFGFDGKWYSWIPTDIDFSRAGELN